MPVCQYFTSLKALWDELNNVKPLDLCDCCHYGKMKKILDLRSQEYTIQFLMGLNDSYSQIWGQILHNDPIPSITKVFSLIVQEEKQRKISFSSLSHEIAALMTRTPQFGNRFVQPAKQNITRKERPICSHCKIPGHTVYKCYKLHGYPTSFKFTRNKTAPHLANYVHEVSIMEEFSSASQLFSPQLPITSYQCQQLMSMLQHYSPPVISLAETQQAVCTIMIIFFQWQFFFFPDIDLDFKHSVFPTNTILIHPPIHNDLKQILWF